MGERKFRQVGVWEQGSCGLEDRDSLEEGGVEGGERVGTGELGKGPPGGGIETPKEKREEPGEGRAYGR